MPPQSIGQTTPPPYVCFTESLGAEIINLLGHKFGKPKGGWSNQKMAPTHVDVRGIRNSQPSVRHENGVGWWNSSCRDELCRVQRHAGSLRNRR
jgi:hypothetical protein